jgi:Fe-S-cluster containining protein
MKMDSILQEYGKHLRKVGIWFDECAGKHPTAITCRTGCSECCRGLFDITLLDALYLKSGFDRLDVGIRARVMDKTKARLLSLQALWPDFEAPYILNYRPEEEWEILMPEDDETSCTLLSEGGTCLVYDFRPMTCRLHGLPLKDISGEVLHDEWCTLNFVGENPLEMEDLSWEFYALFREELRIFREFTKKIFKKSINELDTFIVTAILIDFDHFPWRKWRKENPFIFPDIHKSSID